MHITRDLSEFVIKNNEEVKAIILSRTGPIDNYVLEDHIQEVYLSLAKYKTLKKWDEKKGSFERWITTQICWHLSKDKDKNKNKIKTEVLHPGIISNNYIFSKELYRLILDYELYLYKNNAPKTAILLTYLKARLYGYPKKNISKKLKNIKAVSKLHDEWFKKFIEYYS